MVFVNSFLTNITFSLNSFLSANLLIINNIHSIFMINSIKEESYTDNWRMPVSN